MPSHSTADYGSGRLESETTTSYSLPASPKLTNVPSRDHSPSNERPFDVVTRKLKEIGAIPVDDFLSDKPLLIPPRTRVTELTRYSTWPTYDIDVARAPYISAAADGGRRTSNPPLLGPAPLSERNMNGDTKPNLSFSRDNAISRLHQTCLHAFGSADLLKYEFLEENGQKSKQCILTITRSDGQLRSYKSEPVFLRRADAKARAATLAVQMGALGFLLGGNSEAIKGNKVQPVSQMEATGVQDALPEPTPPESLIRNCLLEWRAGKIHPEWIIYNDSRVMGQYGAALRIQLTKHSLRVYSCDSTFNSEYDAQAACAKKALDEGVLDYIKFGNGQKEPTPLCLEDREPELFDQQRPLAKGKARPMTLQFYYESLPRPFPESFGNKTAVEINAPSYINTLLQSARGGRLKYNFYWTTDKNTGLFGCLLRLERGQETKTYFADQLFQRRNDAKAAACLQALSQGFGDYIRSVRSSMDDSFTPEMRKLASEKLIFALNTECNKIRQGNRLNFTYTDDLDAFGADLEIDISCNPEVPDPRKWTVPAEYRSKSDAKLAVCYRAVSEGAIEVLRFKGVPPPSTHIPYWDVVHGKGPAGRAVKRKSVETDVGEEGCNQQKKRRKELQKTDMNASGPSSAPTATTARLNPLGEKRPLHVSFQELDGFIGRDISSNPGGGPMALGGEDTGRPASSSNPDSSLVSQTTPYYPPSVMPGIQCPVSPQMLTPTTTPSMYYQPAPSSPIAFTTAYHQHSAIPDHFSPHPSIYHPQFMPSYSQPAASPYHAMPSPYCSPYLYPSLSPIYLPSTPDGRLMEIRDYRQGVYHHPCSQIPLHPISPPSTPPRPQKIKRIDRNAALSPLKAVEILSELEEVGKRNENEWEREKAGEMMTPVTGREVAGLEPGELTETEDDVSKRHQVLERRASIP